MSSFEICNVRANVGTKVKGFISVTETATTNVIMPIAIINGSRPGPKICITVGIHGAEYSSIEAVIRVINKVNPKDLAGILIAIPIVNLTAFESRGPQGGLSTAFQCPIDAININRIFPGHKDGSASHRIAYVLLNQVIGKSDYYLDFHGGDLCEELVDHVIIPKTGIEKVDNISREILAQSFNCEIVTESSRTRANAMGAAANILNIPAIISESGGYGRLDENCIKFHMDGIMNVLKNIKMIEGVPFKKKNQKIRPRFILGAKHGGLFYGVPLGTKVKEDQKIGQVKNVFGESKYTIKSPANGIIVFKRAILPCSRGDRLFAIFPDEQPGTPPPSIPYP